jgi:hypothetical protein
VVHLEGSTRLGQNPCSDGRFSGAWLPGGVPTGIIWPSKRNSVNNPLIYCEKRKSPYAEMAVAVLKRQERTGGEDGEAEIMVSILSAKG